MSSLPGGSSSAVPSAGVRFTDIVDDSGPEVIPWAKKGPKWRKTRSGLCLEGNCTNKKCKAYNHLVIMNLGYCEFDFINESYLCVCPSCKEPDVEPITCAFNNCSWKTIARKYVVRKRPKKIETEWKNVGNKYHRFSPEKKGLANFLDLMIICKQQDSRQVCDACGYLGELETAHCGHRFHARCHYRTSVDQDCIICIGCHNMTHCQLLFS